MKRLTKRLTPFCAYNRLAFILGLLTGLATSTHALAATSGGFVYVMTNQTTANSIIQYRRASDGSLTRLHEAATGGFGGTGNGVGALDPLGSQDSLVLTEAGSLLLAVNAGSNQLSSLAAGDAGLLALSIVDSRGAFPNSVAVHGNLVYVLNAHTPNIAAFRLETTGVLTPIAGAVFAVPGGAAAKPHDIRFSPDGTRLLVSVEGTNEIDVFALDNAGLVMSVTTQSAAGTGPFSLRFGRSGVLVNAEAGTGSVSSYVLNADDTLTVISGAVPDTQAASCWLTLTGDGKFAFVSNTASGTISTYQISGNGTLTLEQAVTATLGAGAPIDSALSSDSAFLYVLDSASGRIVSFGVHGASLKPLAAVTGLPTTLQGWLHSNTLLPDASFMEARCGNSVSTEESLELLTSASLVSFVARAARAGLLHVKVAIGEPVTEGQEAAEISDIWGETVERVKFARAGITGLIWSHKAVNTGDPIVRCWITEPAPRFPETDRFICTS